MFRNLMIVAHPDDESLFGGSQLLKDQWKVVCVTNGNNPVRSKEFEQVMTATNSEGEIWSYPDSQFIPFNESKLFLDLKKVIDCGWNKIVTHNAHGEYGHLHHQQIHRLVSNITQDFWVFNFTGEVLADDVWQQKLNLISMHRSQKHICEDHILYVRKEKIVKFRNTH